MSDNIQIDSGKVLVDMSQNIAVLLDRSASQDQFNRDMKTEIACIKKSVADLETSNAVIHPLVTKHEEALDGLNKKAILVTGGLSLLFFLLSDTGNRFLNILSAAQ